MGPLTGRRVLVTRSVRQAPALCTLLQARGAVPVCFATMEFQGADPAPLRRALSRLEWYSWLGFTSATAVHFFCSALRAAGRAALPASLRVAAIGPATAAAASAHGMPVDVLATIPIGRGLARAMGEVRGLRVLLPRAAGGRPALATALRSGGAEVDDLAIYQAVRAMPDGPSWAALRRGVDAATFTSGSTVRFFGELAGTPALAGTVVACLGPTSVTAAEALGLVVQVTATRYTLASLVEALSEHFASSEPPP